MLYFATMRTKDAVAHFGGVQAELARALSVSRSAVSQWEEFPPDDQQLKLQQITEGALKAEPEVVARYRALLGQEAA